MCPEREEEALADPRLAPDSSVDRGGDSSDTLGTEANV